MADETTVVAAGDVTEPVVQDNAEETTLAKPVEGGEVVPQATETEGDVEPKPHKKGGWQRKIERLEEQNRVLVELLTTRREEPKPAVKAEEDSEPDPEKFESTLEYLKARDAWRDKQWEKRVETILEQREQQKSQKTEAQKQAEAWEAKKEAARKTYADFDEALEADVPVSKAMSTVLLTSEKGADLAYYLGTHPEEAAKIAKLDDVQTAYVMGRIEAQLASPPPVEKEEKPAPPVTKAPKPPQPVKKGAPADDGQLRDDLSPEEWKKRFAVKMGWVAK